MDSEQSVFIKKIMSHGSLTFKKGELSVYNVPGMLFPLITLILQQKIMENKIGVEAHHILYDLGRKQGRMGGEVMYKQFGYARNRKNSELAMEQGQMIGVGMQKYTHFDLPNRHFRIKNINTPFSHHYLKCYGMQKEPVDHFIRGLIVGAQEALCQTELAGIETQCIAMGKPYCIIEVKERYKWNLNDKFVKRQFPTKKIHPSLLKEINLLSFRK